MLDGVEVRRVGKLLKIADVSHFCASFRSEARNLLLAID
jgi:hypothetical protein